MRAYDITFADFEKRLYGDGNAVTLGSDLAGLILAGLTATTGNAATKSVLGAASAGVIGAKAAIDKDLYYPEDNTSVVGADGGRQAAGEGTNCHRHEGS
jgi:hypothetical protein